MPLRLRLQTRHTVRGAGMRTAPFLRRATPLSVPRQYTISSNTKDSADLYSFSSGRFLYNENLRLSERYVEFDVTALKQKAERSLEHGRVSKMRVLAEGGFNRVFLLAMEDGFEITVKIPYASTVPKHYATASEVATLTFLRSKGLPVPQVYDWSSKGPQSDVGVEYIMMEKAPGIGLDTIWFDIKKEQSRDLVSSYVDIETKLFLLPFGSYGSIYFKEDVPTDLQAPLYQPGTPDDHQDSDRYCMGPIADYMFWYGKRAEMPFSRGPWKDPSHYLLSIGQRESIWTSSFGKPSENRFPFNAILERPVDPESHLQLLNQYNLLAPYLLPKDSKHPFNCPTLRHPDLTPQNVLISPETHKISCLIDWQHACVLPRLLVAGHPPSFEPPELPYPSIPKKPSLPDDYGSLSEAEKDNANELFRRRMLCFLYQAWNGVHNVPHRKALYEPLLRIRQLLVDRAGRQWNANLVTFRAALIAIVDHWSDLQHASEVKCPVMFTDIERQEHATLEEEWNAVAALVDHWREELGHMNEEGWVREEVYDEAVARNKQLKSYWLEKADDDAEDRRQIEEGWPFQDHEEIE